MKNYSIAIQMVRASAKSGTLEYSNHARQRMVERTIEDIQVEDCISKGEVIEVQNHENIKILFHSSKNPIYVVVSSEIPSVVITVCKSDNEVWQEINGIKKRRATHGK